MGNTVAVNDTDTRLTVSRVRLWAMSRSKNCLVVTLPGRRRRMESEPGERDSGRHFFLRQSPILEPRNLGGTQVRSLSYRFATLGNS